MAEVASYFTINISSPNTPGLRDLQAPEALDALLVRLQEARAALPGKAPPLLVKLAPDLAEEDLPEVVRVILARGVDGIIVSNTTLARDGLRDQGFARETGGLSGRPLFARSTRMLARVYRLQRRQAAADRRGRHRFRRERRSPRSRPERRLLQLYTGLVFEGPGLIGRIKQALLGAMESAKTKDLRSLIGVRADEWASYDLQES